MVTANTTTDLRSGVTGELGIKAPARVASLTNITLEAEQTINGIAVVANDIVLVTGQTDTTENGVYIASTSAWTRAVWFDDTLDAVSGTLVLTVEGTSYSNTLWETICADNPIDFGTSEINFIITSLFEDTASEAEAIAGIVNNKLMTPLRTAQEIQDYQFLIDNETIAKSVSERFNYTINIENYANFQAAHDALPAEGGVIQFPVGTYSPTGIITKPIIIMGLGSIEGQGNGVIFTSNSTTANMFSATSMSGLIIENIKFTSSVTKTAGSYINITTSNRLFIRNSFFEKYYIAIKIDGGSEVSISDCQFFNGTSSVISSGSCAINLGEINYTGSVSIDNCYIKCDNTSTQQSFGISAKFVDGLFLTRNTIISCTQNLFIAPGNSQIAALIFSDSSIYDTAVNGVLIEPTGTGLVIRSSFSKCSFSEMTSNGFVIDGSSGSTNGIIISDSHFVNNDISGINIDGINAKNITLNCNILAGNFIGARLSNSASNIRILNNEIGASDGSAVNATGVAIESTITGQLSGNHFGSNTANLSNSASSNNFPVTNNIGLATQGVWVSYTPTISSVAGAITTSSASGFYSQDNKTINFTVSITITTNGTGSGGLNITLPVASKNASVAYGTATLSGKMTQGSVAALNSTMVLHNYDGTYPASSGEVIKISGTYEIS